MGMQWVVNSKQSCKDFCEAVESIYQDNKYVIFHYKLSRSRSLPQNALFQKWAREFAAHEMRCSSCDVSVRDHTRTKQSLKRAYYSYSADPEIIVTEIDILTGKNSPPRAASTSDLSSGSMFALLEFTQNLAADRGLILESCGEFWELKVNAS